MKNVFSHPVCVAAAGQAIVALALLSAHSAFAQHTRQGPVPAWVKPIEGRTAVISDTSGSSGGVEYLLVDEQYHLGSEEIYQHQVLRYTSSTGVQGQASVSVEFDPAFQELTFHEISIIRDGVARDQSAPGRVQMLQRETDLHASMYDGTWTAIVELQDVHVGDLLEWSYTCKGWNPAHHGKFHERIPLAYGVPVGRVYARVLANGADTKVKTFAGAPDAMMATTAQGRELSWDLSDLHAVNFEDDVPPWIDQAPGAEISEFEDLGALHGWALELFNVNDRSDAAVSALAQRFAGNGSPSVVVDSALRWVQQEVRYLGMEAGIGAYRPHAPGQVLAQRYGDCKDKSLLLCAILNDAGVEAYPALVNTAAGRGLRERLPGHGLFDHCIVAVPGSDGPLFVDPTLAYNGGPLHERYVGDLGWALVLQPGKAEWTKVIDRSIARVVVEEDFTIDSIGGSALLAVSTRFEGARADGMRSEFARMGLKEVTDNYRDFYARTYGELQVLNPVEHIDRDAEGVFITRERYRVLHPWGQNDAKDSTAGIVCNFYPQFLRDMITGPGTPHRERPYWCKGGLEARHIIRVHLPEPWTIVPSLEEITAPGLRFLSSVSYADRLVEIEYRYSVEDTVIEPEEIGRFVDAQDRMVDQLGYSITYSSATSETSGGTWWLVLVVLICCGIAIWFVRKAWLYDPPARGLGNGYTIGGWLILPSIGLSLGPMILVFSLFGFFRDIVGWPLLKAPWTATTVLQVGQVLFIYTEIMMNAILFFGNIGMLLLFFKRRSSVRVLMVTWYIVNLVILVFDSGVTVALFDVPLQSEAFSDISRALVAVAIWVPYFLVSERVKRTFVIRRNGPLQQASVYVPESIVAVHPGAATPAFEPTTPQGGEPQLP
ncbi:MAG: DUF2569 family protein [Flavobacteriales bacterium]